MSLLAGPTQTYLDGWLKSGAVEPPVLLTGPDAAVQQAAQGMAMRGLCESRRRQGDSGSACQKCLACRQVKNAIHPDLNILREVDDAGIEVLRGLLNTISRKAHGGRRIIILEAVERFSIPAVNALLKTLEEPAASARFILTTRYPGRLPATLKSRCQVVRVADPYPRIRAAEDEIEKIGRELSELLNKDGPSPALRRAFLRLRDYYRIKSARGNTNLAHDVLRYSHELGKRL